MVHNQFYDDPGSLPSGVQRIAYDSDSQRYTFRDEKGRVYLGNPGEGFTTFENSITAKETRPMFNSEDFHEYNAAHSKLKSFSDILPSSAVTAATPVDDARQKHNRSPSKLASVARKLTLKKPKNRNEDRHDAPRMHDVVRGAMQREDQAERERERAYRGERAYDSGGHHGGVPNGYHDAAPNGHPGAPPNGYRSSPPNGHRGSPPVPRGCGDDPFSDSNAVAIKTAAGMRGPPPRPIDYPDREEYGYPVREEHGRHARHPSPSKYRG
ncbi:hypothetical protein HDZ31DRAFT_79832 [Schizophyllum fasciatum]